MKIKLNGYLLVSLLLSSLLVGPAGVVAMEKMEDNPAGMLTGAKGHHAKGLVAITKGMDGHVMLTLGDIKVDKVPDGYVYLAKDGDHTKGVPLGMLKQFTGTISFNIPAGTDLDAYNSVVIWCRKYSVEIGRARLSKEMM